MTEPSKLELASQRPKKRINDLLVDIASKSGETDRSGSRRRQVDIRFLLNPIEFLPSTDDPSKVAATRFERTELVGELGAQQAKGTGKFVEIPCDLVLKSIGYRSHPLPGLPFDTRTLTIPQQAGRVLEDGQPRRGWYVTGWLKRGPSGRPAKSPNNQTVPCILTYADKICQFLLFCQNPKSGIIGANIVDAKETVSAVLADVENDLLDNKSPDEALEAKLRDLGVTWAQYERIELEELRRGTERSKSMEKVVTPSEMLKIARSLHHNPHQ